MDIPQISPTEAKDMLDQDPQALYVDVRSVPEFAQEHPEGAINIPLLHQDPISGSMMSNPDFLTVAQGVLPKDQKLIVGCLRGGRSQKACEMLAAQGYAQLYNVEGGFGGAMDPMTGRTLPGWKASGLPTSRENGEGVGYEYLKAKLG